jgi:hypothetical protein
MSTSTLPAKDRTVLAAAPDQRADESHRLSVKRVAADGKHVAVLHKTDRFLHPH